MEHLLRSAQMRLGLVLVGFLRWPSQLGPMAPGQRDGNYYRNLVTVQSLHC